MKPRRFNLFGFHATGASLIAPNKTGRATRGQYARNFTFKPSSKDAPWGRDMDRLFLALAVVDSNTANSAGGGGTPRQPLAPPFASQ